MNSSSEMPSFLKNATRLDWALYAGLIAVGIYGFAIIPFRATLLLNHTMVYTVLTGSSLSVLSHAASNPGRWAYLGGVVLLAAASSIKFLPLFFLIGKRWGREFLDSSFGGRPPLWFRKLERFIHNHIGISMALAYVPFSPIAPTIIAVVGGIARARGWAVMGFAFVFAIALKSFYVYLGITFGTQVQSTLMVIDRYVTWITLGLVAYMFAAIYYKQNRKK
ncbi:hypothetical protein NQ015_02475 [Corynebacterium sp. 153RC1]|uniref:hypothetical protein n=1 Tax=unclassified Corynebacterium TaxID=2624378 RepID=UPI00211BC6EE|nr:MULTISPECIES: hypothetical protein [unclassified Corynebacterium]MCQ9370606.1 hypothetical protein [Corynebacterium sp. 35RC1]MCQ9351739.1 hypothetical protein [Corynebacterium sp. 209RC1]MCQ9354475.1 hypothetical protein [Corynebacterium sp. 1222RC1]MCQ9356021.1 hypothetical protein [Corynebacterium sp. 122RC1]MCQ9358653.1 hypothetical protein [Corynebacterium sp. 142RC1]